MNCDWISRKCCPFWPFSLKAKDDAKYQFDPNNHIKIEPKAEEEKGEMREISNINDNDFTEIQLDQDLTGLENENQDDDIIKEIKNRKEMANYTIKREMMNFSELGITPEELCTSNNQLEQSRAEDDKTNVNANEKISLDCSLDLEYETSDDPSDIR